MASSKAQRSERPWATAAFVMAAVAFGVINAGNALHKGGDFDVFRESGARLLAGSPLYEGSSPGSGVIGPPFQALFFTPFAWLATTTLAGTQLAWYAVNLPALFVGAWLWRQALSAAGSTSTSTSTASVVRSRSMEQPAFRPAGWADLKVGPSVPIICSLLAVALPTQTNFEHQNMNPLLLATVGAGALLLARRRHIAGGSLIGCAAALKAFPALLVVYLALRRQWRSACAAGAVATVLTVLPLLRYGWTGAMSTFADWLRINQDGYWPIREQNQSLYAMAQRVAPSAAGWMFPLGVCVLLGLVGTVARRCARVPSSAIGIELALVLAVSVVLSPIAWDHYSVLMFPAFLAAFPSAGQAAHRYRFYVFVAAALLVSGLSPLTLPGWLFTATRWWSATGIAGLLLVGALCTMLLRRRATGSDDEAGQE